VLVFDRLCMYWLHIIHLKLNLKYREAWSITAFLDYRNRWLKKSGDDGSNAFAQGLCAKRYPDTFPLGYSPYVRICMWTLYERSNLLMIIMYFKCMDHNMPYIDRCNRPEYRNRIVS